MESKRRLAVYVDGFNLYFGMVGNGCDHCKWLDLVKLSEDLKSADQTIVFIKYFTSRIKGNPDKEKRQQSYIKALQFRGIEVIEGKYNNNTTTCRKCSTTWKSSQEKMTDVNIATHLIVDAYKDEYDVAILISADSDLVPPIKAIGENFPAKAVSVYFPPGRITHSVKMAASGWMELKRKQLEEAQFPKTIQGKGFTIDKPKAWK